MRRLTLVSHNLQIRIQINCYSENFYPEKHPLLVQKLKTLSLDNIFGIKHI